MNKCRDWNEIEDSDLYLENDPNEIDIFPVSVVYAVLSDGVPPVASPFIRTYGRSGLWSRKKSLTS